MKAKTTSVLAVKENTVLEVGWGDYMLLTFRHHKILRALGSILDAGILGT